MNRRYLLSFRRELMLMADALQETLMGIDWHGGVSIIQGNDVTAPPGL